MAAKGSDAYSELTNTEPDTRLAGLVAVGAKVDEGPWRALVLVRSRNIAQAIVRELESHPEYDGPYCRALTPAEAAEFARAGVVPGVFYPQGCGAGEGFRHSELRQRLTGPPLANPPRKPRVYAPPSTGPTVWPTLAWTRAPTPKKWATLSEV